MRVLIMLVCQFIGFTWLGSQIGAIPLNVFLPVLFLQLVGLVYGMTANIEGGKR
jgi:hypothetical protein